MLGNLIRSIMLCISNELEIFVRNVCNGNEDIKVRSCCNDLGSFVSFVMVMFCNGNEAQTFLCEEICLD